MDIIGTLGTAVVGTAMDLAGVKKGTEEVEGLFASVGQKMTQAGKALTLGITAPIVGFGVAAASSAIEFDKAFMSVNSVVKLTGDEMERFRGEILKLSTEASQSSADVALSMRGIVTAGVAAADAEEVLAVTLSQAGNMMVDTATSTKALTGVMAAFGYQAQDVTHIADVLQTASTKSAVQFDLLASNIGQATGVAAAAGVSFEELTAGLMTTVDAGYGVASASTSMRALITSLLKPTDELSDVIAGWGYESGQAALESLGLAEVMVRLGKETGDDAALMFELVGNVRAAKAAFALSRQDGDAFADSLREVGEASEGVGEHARMTEIRHESWSYTLNKLKSEIEVITIRLGNTFVPMLIEVAGSVKDVAETIATADPEMLKMGVTVAAVAAAAGPLLIILPQVVAGVGTLVTVVTAVPAVVGGATAAISAAKVGYVLYAEGATIAEIATLGLDAALIPLAVTIGAVVVALVAVGYALKEAHELQVEMAARTEEVGAAWTGMLQDLVAEEKNATEVMDEYVLAQKRVNDTWESSNVIVRGFIDRQVLAGASTEELAATVMEASENYTDYVQAMGMVNREARAYNIQAEKTNKQAGRTVMEVKEVVDVLDQQTFALIKGEREVHDGWESWIKYGKAVDESADSIEAQLEALEAQATSAEDAKLMLESLSGALELSGLSARGMEMIQYRAAIAMGETTALTVMQRDAMHLLSHAVAQGVLSQEQWEMAGRQVYAVNEDSAAGYDLIRNAVNEATGGMFNLGAITGELPENIHAVTMTTQEAAVAAQEMAVIQQEAWQTFVESVSGAVGQALTAYREGNAEMLLEQQTALANLLFHQTESMQAMGEITAQQAAGMKAAIAETYGVDLGDETQLGTDALLGMFGDWAAGGETSIDQIIGFIGNIGEETDALVIKQEEDVARMIAGWENVAAGTEESTRGMEESMGGASLRILETVGEIELALAGLTERDYRINIAADYTAPPEFQFESPHFAFERALRDVVDLAQTTPIEVGVVSGGEAGVAETLPVGGLSATGGGAGDTFQFNVQDHVAQAMVLEDIRTRQLERAEGEM